jgi:hypothetical protein
MKDLKKKAEELRVMFYGKNDSRAYEEDEIELMVMFLKENSTNKKFKGIKDAIINAEEIKKDGTTITKLDFIDAFSCITRSNNTDIENIRIGEKLSKYLENMSNIKI